MKVQNDVRVTIRVDKDIKERADILFDRLGINMSTALNVFLRKAVDEEGIPFAVNVAKSTGFGTNLSSSDITRAFGDAARNEISQNQRNGYPVARYDSANNQAYLESSDGTREYVNG